jgi:putative acetyltransferase
MTSYRITPDALDNPAVLALLQLHLDEMYAFSPAEKVHALPAEKLRASDVGFFSAWDGETLAAVGALKDLGGGRGELKSMRAAPAYRGKGAGRAMLGALLEEAARRGLTWVGLETGRPAPFADAQRLYAANGFTECAPFGDYVSDDFSLCMERTLQL